MSDEILEQLRERYPDTEGEPNPPSEEQVKEFFSVLGIAITRWNAVENALYEVFRATIRADRPGALAASFASLQHSKTQLSMTDTAARYVILTELSEQNQQTMLEEWEKLQKQVSNKLERRNTFAHWQVSAEYWKKHDNDKVMLRPASHDSRYAVGMKELPIYRLTEIQGISDCFLELYNKLNAFARKITALKEPAVNFHLLPDVEE